MTFHSSTYVNISIYLSTSTDNRGLLDIILKIQFLVLTPDCTPCGFDL